MTDNEANVEGRLLRAARRILRPLVRILLRNGVTAQSAQELIRKTYVDVAFEEFPPEGRAQTLANVSVITGLNRKEVARLHKLEGLGDGDKTGWTRAGKVLDGWLTDPEFHNDAGFPLDLPFSGTSPSFSDLVRKYSGDMYPLPLRDELVRVGALTEADGLLRLSKQGYVPAKDEGAKIDILGVDAAEFIETVDHNIKGEQPNLVQYKVLADNLPADRVPAFNEYARRVAIHAFDDIRRWLIEHDAGSRQDPGNPGYFAGLGIFQIVRPRARKSDAGEDNERSKDD